MNFVYFVFFVAGVVAFFAFLAAGTQYEANKDRFGLDGEYAAVKALRLYGSIAVAIVGIMTAYMMIMLNNGWFFEARFLGESTYGLMAQSDIFFRFAHSLFGLVFGFLGFLLALAAHAVVSVIMMFVLSPNGYKYDSESLHHEVIDSNSKSERFWYLFQHRGVRTSISLGLSYVLVIILLGALFYYESFGKHKFYQTTIETPISILSILDSKCESNAAIYTNDKIMCDDKTLLSSNSDFFNGDDGKAIIVVWNEGLTSRKVVFRADSKFAPPTESVAEMTTQLQGHFDLANIALAESFSSELTSFERRVEWESLQL